MSMLSAQCDELRELATKYDELQVGAVRAVRIPLDTGSVLREAADTITELRDDLQRANAENARLREQSERLFDKTLELATENSKLRELCKLCEREAENRKLWELVRNLLRVIPRDVSGVVVGAHGEHPTYYSFADAMRELGVEVEP